MKTALCYNSGLIVVVLVSGLRFAVAQDFELDLAETTPTPSSRVEERDILSVSREKSPCEGVIGGCLVPASDYQSDEGEALRASVEKPEP